MTTFEGALIREQGVEFTVVAVRPHAISNRATAAQLIGTFAAEFGRPVVLVAFGAFGRSTWYGRPDIVRFMRDVSAAAIPWRRFTIH